MLLDFSAVKMKLFDRLDCILVSLLCLGHFFPFLLLSETSFYQLYLFGPEITKLSGAFEMFPLKIRLSQCSFVEKQDGVEV